MTLTYDIEAQDDHTFTVRAVNDSRAVAIVNLEYSLGATRRPYYQVRTMRYPAIDKQGFATAGDAIGAAVAAHVDECYGATPHPTVAA